MAKKPKDEPYSGMGTTVSTTAGNTANFKQASDERRIKDVEAARTIYNRLQANNLLRSQIFSQVRNQLEGGRPFNPDDLAKQGATWQTNCNFNDAKAARDRTLLPYWKMVNDVPRRISVTIKSNNPNSEKWQVAIAEAFDEFLEDWGADYFIQYMNMASNFVNFGPGVVQWQDLDDPRFKSVNVQRIVWPKNARMSPNEWELVCFDRDVSASELYTKVKDKKNRKSAEYAGWNLQAVEKAITYFKDGNFTPDPRDYTRWQDYIVNNDLMIASVAEPLQLVWMFYKQYNGKIGCYVFTLMGGVDEFLFKDEEYAEDFRHLMGAVWYDTGVDSMVHSIKGFGIKNYYFSALLNRVKSRLVDASTMALGINFQRGENMPDEAPPVEQYGPYTVFPSGLTQLAIYPQIQQSAAVMEMLAGNMAQNNALYQEQGRQIEETDTATQAKLLAAMQGELSEASASIYLAQVGENIFSEQVRKLRRKGNQNSDAQKFVARLLEKGVPLNVIHDYPIIVKTGANAGMASAAVRDMTYQQLLGMMNIPGINSRWILESYFANKLGPQSINKVLLPEGQNSKPMQRREALMENQMFGQGQPLPVDPADAHVEHAEEHIGPLEQLAMQFRGSGELSPEQIMALTIGIEHTGQHMGYIEQDSTLKNAFQALNPRFRQIQSVARGILTRISQQENNPQSPSPVTAPMMN